MGRVWVAEHVALAREVAIKVISEEALSTPVARELFVREAKATARVDSAHVVRVLDFDFTDDGFPFLVLERLVGETLEERIARIGALTLAETATLVEHIGSAVSAVHACGIVHRDIKAENIFLIQTSDGSIDARLLDFGVAMTKNARPLIAGTVGTAQYMSPEQLTAGAIDERSDLFSLGICVYYALTAQLPFDGASLAEIALALNRKCASVSEYRPTLPLALDAWFVRALARDPAGRFTSAREMSDAFGGTLARRSTERRTPLSIEIDVPTPAEDGVPMRRRGVSRFALAGATLGIVALAALHPARVVTEAERVVAFARTPTMHEDGPPCVERVETPLAVFARSAASEAPPRITIAPAPSASVRRVIHREMKSATAKPVASADDDNTSQAPAPVDTVGFGGRE